MTHPPASDHRRRPARRPAERKIPVPAEVKIGLVHRLQDAGLHEIEVTSLRQPWCRRWPTTHEVMAGIARQPGVRLSAC